MFPLPLFRSISTRATRSLGLAINHSTNIKPLIPYLHKLIAHAGIHRIVPGRLSRKGATSVRFNVKISTPAKGGFKLIAREGTLVQEVFVTTGLVREELEAVVGDNLAGKVEAREGGGKARRAAAASAAKKAQEKEAKGRERLTPRQWLKFRLTEE